MSGLSHTPGKRAKGKTFRGFESRLLRQIQALNSCEFRAFFVVYCLYLRLAVLRASA
jgi:hypothetical protein